MGQLGQGQDFNSYAEYKYIETQRLGLSSVSIQQVSTLVVSGGDTTCVVESTSNPVIRCFGSNDAGTYGHDRTWPDSYYSSEPSADSRAAISQAGTKAV